MISNVLYSSKSGVWETPQPFFDELDREFQFNLDACALPENAKCSNYYTPEQDGLVQPWYGTVWCNPPYGRSVWQWVDKAQREVTVGGAETVVMLLPSRTDTIWFHKYLYNKNNVELRFVKGRLHFGSADRSPFPSLVAVIRK